jgi:hypothetical protein
MNCSEIFEAELVGAVRAVPHTRFFHAKPPLKRPAAAGIRPSSAASRHGLGQSWALTIAPVRDGREL